MKTPNTTASGSSGIERPRSSLNEVGLSLLVTKSKSELRRRTHLALLCCALLFVFSGLFQHVPNVSVGRINDLETKHERDSREITMTNFGWFHPNPRKGLTFMRCQAMRHFNDAILAHERFNASAWQDLEQNPDPERAIIAFLDYDTCQLLHWPKFGGNEFNADLEGGREPFARCDFSKECSMVIRALRSPALSSPDSRLVVMSCKDFGPSRNHCLGGERNASGIFSKLIVGHMSAYKPDTYPLDFGIPPWPVKTVTLNKSQLHEIETCQNSSRSLLFSFVGRSRIPFPEFQEFFKARHGKGGIHVVFQWDHYVQSGEPRNALGGTVVAPVAPENQTHDNFYNVLTSSVFAGSPRGDCLYSVRFSEILSSGAIPVVYADGWVLPYNRDVVDWSDVAVLIPQRRVNETIDILRAIPDETRCQMRKKGLEVYQRYVADSAGRLRAILEIVDAGLARQKRNLSSDPPMEFSAVPES